MSILSFDIGIKNLCFCELNNQGKILDWRIINISNDKPCEHIMKSNKKCYKHATFIFNDSLDNKDILIFTTHRMYKIIPPKGIRVKWIKCLNLGCPLKHC